MLAVRAMSLHGVPQRLQYSREALLQCKDDFLPIPRSTRRFLWKLKILQRPPKTEFPPAPIRYDNAIPVRATRRQCSGFSTSERRKPYRINVRRE